MNQFQVLSMGWDISYRCYRTILFPDSGMPFLLFSVTDTPAVGILTYVIRRSSNTRYAR